MSPCPYLSLSLLAVEEMEKARVEHYKTNTKWQAVPVGASLHFEFPTKLLFIKVPIIGRCRLFFIIIEVIILLI